jgi:hypothetical protein
MMGSYMWAGPAWHGSASRNLVVSGAVMTCDDPQAAAGLWGRILDREPTGNGEGWRIVLDNAALDFNPNGPRGEGHAAIRVRGLTAPTRSCGLDFLPET